MIVDLEVTHTQTRDRRPLAILRNLPGTNAEMTPEQMIGLARALLDAAHECVGMPMDKRHFSRTFRRYPAVSKD